MFSYLRHWQCVVLCWGLISAACAADPTEKYPGFHLIPWPKIVEPATGEMSLAKSARIVCADQELKPLAGILAEEIQLGTGVQHAVADGPAQAGDIVLRINRGLKADQPIRVLHNRELSSTTDGAHTLSIGDQAVVEGFDYRAVAEGTATLLQLLRAEGEAFHFPKVAIKDWPHADYCGLMLDVGRQWHSIDDIKKVVESCRLYKTRYLQIHFTDDQGWTLPSKAYPSLGSQNHAAHGGITPRVYTLEELRDLVAFADARGIAIVPEVEMPGHSGAARRSLPEVFDYVNPATGQAVDLVALNIANEKSYEVIDTLIGELCDIFKSSPFFHIGTDECQTGRLALYPGYKPFLEKHGLKDEGELATHFVRRVNEMIKQRGKKTIKWEGLADYASKDVIIMTWNANSRVAEAMLKEGFITITCPWNYGVEWEDWNMYICNGSHLKRDDAVLGATLVAWEQPAELHVRSVRDGLPGRQERTWGPDNLFTKQGFNERFRPLNALAGRLLKLPPQTPTPATFSTSLTAADLLEPAYAFDGSDDTYFLSTPSVKQGDQFTVTFEEPQSVLRIEVLTGVDGKNAIQAGELQISADGKNFGKVASFAQGAAVAEPDEGQIRAIRLVASAPQSESLAIREIKLSLLTDVAGPIPNLAKVVKPGNTAACKADVTLGAGTGDCAIPINVKGVKLRFQSEGQPVNYSGQLSGSGSVEFYAAQGTQKWPDVPIALSGDAPISFQGKYFLKQGRLSLQKPAGVTAISGDLVVGGQGNNDDVIWQNNNQIADAANVEVLDSPHGAASLRLNGFDETFASLTLADQTSVSTDGANGRGGILRVEKLTVNGKALPAGIYSAAEPWLKGSGLVLVGDMKRVELTGDIENANHSIDGNSVAVLTGPTKFDAATGDFSQPILIGDFSLALHSDGTKPVHFAGPISGKGGVEIRAGKSGSTPREAFEFFGAAPNFYTGVTRLPAGTLKLNKSGGVTSIPGELNVGGSDNGVQETAVIWGADEQVFDRGAITVDGSQYPSLLDLSGHHESAEKLTLKGQAKIKLGGGTLKLKQFYLNGTPLSPGEYRAPLDWLEGSGAVIVDPKVDIAGSCEPNVAIRVGNVANMVGDTMFAWGGGLYTIPVLTNGHTLVLDSGNGNAFCYAGPIAGTGNIEFHMGPTSTGFKDAPMRLAGDQPNTASGKYLVKKGRVQLEKPENVDAIAGDVIIGGQGFNDCLYWLHSHQIKDTVNVTLIDSPNSGAAYLGLNGCRETVGNLTMTSNNRILTDGTEGKGGELTVETLTVGGEQIPAGSYGSDSQTWIEGEGKVIVLH